MIINMDLGFSPDWCVIMPIKGGAMAKSRLGSQPDLLDAPDVTALADRFANLTLAAVLACPEVSRVVIVTADDNWSHSASNRISTVQDPGQGLNAALCVARDHEVNSKFLAIVPSDLPLLDPYELATVLQRARSHVCGFVRDKDGTGTTLLTALEAIDLQPKYGEGSAEAHLKSGAIELSAPLTVRFDVDTLADLNAMRDTEIRN